ncbi:MAG: lipopolysaccharide transport periplasmic protein LptA [Gallionellales bacterium CG_4_10_14_3_um_filter_54_96]|nr:MAG: lipopolysaccharide transport periplasmic protein LptA [Gallionellaceae bacterium CG1_02_56_997]PIV15718.1 MAG: lipopolysaccharide transport periplasmic protein LptA [Gallionellales bacterium CG03_land_8_20_14_0_80_55_15]PIV91752.1 MAG: lipopolysaccharide transport periplasmic protein LptA [Gallionellales bacterium CG17_big_fil_post_rev_8_21_14_2_50_54_146]PIX04809.1 MAG: lipopolysaccharide transport periplasmic protein LptA [Gallionellales bacterium CG_4_8_14_3_um_filter_54_18]PIY04129.
MRNKLLLLILLLLGSPVSHAERADREQPVNIEADRVLIDNAKQISTFEGRVQMTQGTMVIRGDKVVVVQDKDGFQHGTVYGHTASFRQKREGLNEYVEGYAERIEYDMRSDLVDFYVQARVKRSQDDVRGEHITYNTKTEIFQADGGKAASSGAAPSRVRAVLHPKPKTADQGAGDAPVSEPGNTPSAVKRK